MAQQQSRIQLRGISHSPSSRMVQDGGVADSENVQLRDDELVPTPVPDFVRTEDGDEWTEGVAVYIHKTNNYTHIINIQDDTLYANYMPEGSEKRVLLMDLSLEGKLLDIKHVGNILIVITEDGMYYFLCKGDEYVCMGDRIPNPEIKFYTTLLSSPNNPVVVSDKWSDDSSMESSAYADFLCRQTSDRVVKNAVALDIMQDIRGTVEIESDAVAASGCMLYATFLRYAVRMFDGSVINVSAPVLLGNFEMDPFPFDITLQARERTVQDVKKYTYGYTLSRHTNKVFKCMFKADFSELELWKDMIEGIDIYCSLPIRVASDYTKVRLTPHVVSGGYDYQIVPDYEHLQELEKRILSYTDDFRLLKSYTLDEALHLGSGPIELDSKRLNDSDWIATQQVLPPYYKSCHATTFKHVDTLNSRMIGLQGTRTLYGGYPYANGPVDGYSDQIIEYSIASEEGVKVTACPVVDSMSEGTTYISYPDARCSKAYVMDNSLAPVMCVLSMSPSGTGDFAHAFLGWGKTWRSCCTSPYDDGSNVPSIDNKEDLSNKIVQSEYGNPFSLPASGYMTFSALVTAVAQATRPLSTGQFGEYPLYVFTEDGIEAVNLANDGSFVSHKPLARDVSLSRDFVTPIDQEVVFLSRRGVMLISGGDIICLSTNMVGKVDTISSEIKSLINRIFKGKDAIKDMDFMSGNDFLDFMKGARCAYDYAGSRLLFFNPDRMGSASGGSDIYIYKLDTKTWHKSNYRHETEYGRNRLYRPLNSYPDCLISTTAGEDGDTEGCIMNFTTPSDGYAYGKSDILIYTRPFDFGQPDVLKSIYSVKIRSTKGADIRYALEGSQDGVDFTLVTSLKGKAYKFYRMFIVGKNLGRGDALTWVDFVWEPRFTNKLR